MTNPKPEIRGPNATRNPKAEAGQSESIRFVRRSNFRFSTFNFQFLIPLLLLLFRATAFPQAAKELKPPSPLPPAEGRKVAAQLIANLLAQNPTANSTNSGVILIRDAERHQHQVPVQIEILPGATNFLNVYRTTAAGSAGMELTIVHAGELPNKYLLREPANSPQAKALAPTQLMLPFAGSDFSAADLGLDFLHWPQQRVVKKEMRKSNFCDVLESTNPHPAPGAYSRVVSWIGANHPDETVLVHADAYDSQGKLLKEFDPKKLEKVNGAWQLESMELRNIQTGSRTIFQFDLTNE